MNINVYIEHITDIEHIYYHLIKNALESQTIPLNEDCNVPSVLQTHLHLTHTVRFFFQKLFLKLKGI